MDLRRSYWIYAEDFSVSKVSGRFKLVVDGEAREVAAERTMLLAFWGSGWISSEAFLLAYEKNTQIVVLGARPVWIRLKPLRDIKYLLGLYSSDVDLGRRFVDNFALDCARFLGRRGVALPGDLNAGEEAAKLLQGLRSFLVRFFSERLGVDAGWVAGLASILRGFLEAEAVSFLCEAGLEPGYMLEAGVPLYRFFAAGFEFPVVWKTMSDLQGSYHVSAELGSAVQVRPILRIAKSNLEAIRRGRSIREWMRRAAFSLASSVSSLLVGEAGDGEDYSGFRRS